MFTIGQNPAYVYTLLTKVKNDTHLSIFPLFDAYCDSMPSLK